MFSAWAYDVIFQLVISYMVDKSCSYSLFNKNRFKSDDFPPNIYPFNIFFHSISE